MPNTIDALNSKSSEPSSVESRVRERAPTSCENEEGVQQEGVEGKWVAECLLSVERRLVQRGWTAARRGKRVVLRCVKEEKPSVGRKASVTKPRHEDSRIFTGRLKLTLVS